MTALVAPLLACACPCALECVHVICIAASHDGGRSTNPGLQLRSFPPPPPPLPLLRFGTGFANAITAAIWWQSISEIAAVSVPPGNPRAHGRARAHAQSAQPEHALVGPACRRQTKPYGPLLFLHLPRLLRVAAAQLKDERSRQHRQHLQHLPFACVPVG